MSEQKLQAKILTWLKDKGFWTVKTIVSNRNGVPDILACAPDGKFIAIEVKFGRNKPSRLQEYNVAELNKRGAIALLAWDLETVTTALKSYS